MIRNRLSSLLALALVAAAAACDSLVTKPSLYGSVEVQVTTRTGAAVADVPLTLYTGVRRIAYGKSDANGRFRFDLVPEGRYGIEQKVVPGYALLAGLLPSDTGVFVDQVVVRPGESASTSLTMLKQGPGTVSVQVQLPDGRPVPEVVVSLYSAEGPLREASTNATGTVTFANVPFGNWGVSAFRQPPYLDSAETPFPTFDRIIVDEGSRSDYRFTFEPCFGNIAASVRDSSGVIFANSMVVLYNSQRALDSGLTDAAGVRRFENLPCADFGVRVATVPIGWSIPQVRGVGFADGLFVHRGATRNATMVLPRQACRGSLRARALDVGGAGVAGARLVVYTGDLVWADVVTDPSGVHNFGQLPCEREWGVYVTPPAGYSVPVGSGSSYFDGIRFTTNGELQIRTFTLRRP